MEDEKTYAENLINKMAKEIGTYQTPLVRLMAKRCALIAVNSIMEADTQFYYGEKFYNKVKLYIQND